MIQPVREPAPGVSVVVPCYNEEGAVQSTVDQIDHVLAAAPFESEMIFVNDGSSDRTGQILDELAPRFPRLRVLHNGRNLGYGATLKRGISQARFERIVITDADGTYPNERIPELAQRLDHADMVVGARTGERVKIPLARRPAKWALLNYSRWMAQADIRDINSGLRAIWARHLWTFWSMLPDTFSFTTTITLATHVNRLNVEYLPINYHARIGKSSIRPLRDTLNFFGLVFRTVMYFRPLQVFGTVALMLMLTSVVVAACVKLWTGEVPDVIAVSMFSTGLVLLGMGLLGDLINARRTP